MLDRNPENYFTDVEQIAFDPAHFVPGIEPSPDRMLQGRLFAYGDTHRHRLGPNHLQLPVNCPYKVITLQLTFVYFLLHNYLVKELVPNWCKILTFI